MVSRLWIVPVVLILAAFPLASIAFVIPRLPPAPVASPVMERYSPLHDHEAYFLVMTDAQGKPTAWTGRTLEILPTSRALASHDLNNIAQLTGSVAWRGMELVGLPLLYTIGIIVLARIIRRQD